MNPEIMDHLAKLASFDCSLIRAYPSEHLIISSLSLVGMPPRNRFRLHQSLTASWLFSQEAENLTVGFYTDHNFAVELSLFHGDISIVKQFATFPLSMGSIFIGVGHTSMAQIAKRVSAGEVRAHLINHFGDRYDSSQSYYDLGWSDFMGVHVENVQIYPNGDVDVVRRSMSGRTDYFITLNGDGEGVAIHSAGGINVDPARG